MTRTPPRFIVAALLAAALSCAAAGLYLRQLANSHRQLRDEALQQTQQRVSQVADVVAQQVAFVAATVDFVLLELRDTYARDPRELGPAVQRIARSHPKDLLLQVSVAGADGYVKYSTVNDLRTPIYVGDREHIRVHDDGLDRLFISAPVQGRASGRWSVQFSRPVLRDGRVEAVVVLSLTPEYLAEQLSRQRLDEPDSISIVDGRGRFLTRVPDTESYLGLKTPPDRPYLKPGAPDHGIFVSGYTISRQAQGIFAWRNVPGTSLIAVAAVREAALLEPMERRFEDEAHSAYLVAAVMLACGLGLAALALRSGRQQAALLESESRLRELSEHLEQRVTDRTVELAAATRAAESASQAKSEFLARMSHELRTPLNAILGFAQVLRTRGLAPDLNGYVGRILDAGDDLLRMIEDLLDIARIEAGRLRVEAGDVALAPLVATAAEVNAVARERLRLQLVIDCPAGLRVHADPGRLRQVIGNLLSNAAKYNVRNGLVEVKAYSTGAARVRIDVRDTGTGIAAERLDKLFVPFERLGIRTSDIEGVGIGLALSRHLIEQMGGTIGVDSTVGAGSTFWIEVPQARVPEAPVPAPQQGQVSTAQPRGPADAPKSDGEDG